MMSENTARRWFITGISTGFGRKLARTVARSGDRVLGTVRKQEQVANLASEGIATIIMDVNEIGRASCRERVSQYVYISVVAGTLKNTQRYHTYHTLITYTITIN